jgi:hypothetical protein
VSRPFLPYELVRLSQQSATGYWLALGFLGGFSMIVTCPLLLRHRTDRDTSGATMATTVTAKSHRLQGHSGVNKSPFRASFPGVLGGQRYT